MITVKEIQKKYFKRIKPAFKIEIEKYIADATAQKYIKKAMQCKLTENDYKELFKIGSFKSENYRYLNWLCTVYIHPLTIVSHLANKLNKDGVKIY